MTRPKPTLLAILDGWGIGKKDQTDAIYLADTPNLDRLLNEYPNTTLKTTGRDVGLPKGIMGNSEVGHQNIGAGRVVYQSLVKIDVAIEDGSFFTNPALHGAFEHAMKHDSAVHFMGLLSDGGVHSMQEHLYALLKKARDMGLSKVYVHCFMDGRDTDPKSGQEYMKALIQKMKEFNTGTVGIISGRYYAMDRDKNYDRVKIAYNALVKGEGLHADDPVSMLTQRYKKDETDEFIKPTIITPEATIREKDAVVFFNFRPDRARELSKTLLNKVDDDPLNIFTDNPSPEIYFVSMTQYQEGLNEHVAFPPEALVNTMGEVISSKGLKQLRIAETEKYAHVTFFFNGGEEKVFDGEDRILVDSPKECDGYYDRMPEMSAYKVKDKLLAALNEKVYDLIVLNFANCDMVGHTGVMDAAIQAVEAVDECMGEIMTKITDMGGAMIVTADHGNADIMINDEGNSMTAHSMNEVPLVVFNYPKKINLRSGGRLADISPTLLYMMEMDQPAEMTGENLMIEEV